MGRPKRPILGVVAAEANSIEQRQIIKGISAKAQQFGYDTVVISNVFNPNVVEKAFFCENQIYRLILSDDISAIILISESFVNETLRKNVAEYIRQKDVPVVVIGTYIEEFDIPGARLINTDDKADIYEIISHLIEEHGFTDIDFITGTEGIEASKLRAEGYRKALTDHGIEVDEKKIRTGDFWTSSGTRFADMYADGTIPIPQAIACANDYMAYGLLEGLAKHGIDVPGKVTVIGYEYIEKRMFYIPLLTTYQRNREELGRAAADIIHQKLISGKDMRFTPPKGELIRGDSCPCGRNNTLYYQELEKVKAKRDFEFWNLFTFPDQELTQCRNLKDFSEILGKYHWLVRDAYDIYLCLSSNWYVTDAPMSDMMSCRNIMPWLDDVTFEMDILDIGNVMAMHTEPSVYYFDPLFFGNRFFGYTILRYDKPDTYDDIFRNWIKTVSNSLEYLRMKNDIQYLSKCQNLSDQRDTLTGMYNSRGIESACKTAVPRNGKELFLVMLRVCLFDDSAPGTDNDTRISAIIDASKAVIRFCGNHDISARISPNTFLCLVQSKADASLLADCLGSILLQHKKYMDVFGADSFACSAVQFDADNYDGCVEQLTEDIERQTRLSEERRLINHYREMSEMRNYVYQNPNKTYDTNALHERFSGSTGYFRSIYKQCFGASFHKDCISARIARAKYQLSTTTLSVMDISEKCGYLDSKYFLRQFSSCSGMTPIQYRNLLKS